MSDRARVLIAGAGPTGLLNAYLLARHGIPVCVVESRQDLAKDLRASTFHPSTLDMLGSIGVTDALIAQGVIAPTMQFIDRRDWSLVAAFDFQGLADVTDHPFRLQCEQWKLTAILRERLLSMPHVTLHFGKRVLAVEQDDERVTITVQAADGEDGHARSKSQTGAERLSGGWLIGCDGVGSVVRQAAGLAYEGFYFPEKFFSITTPHDFSASMPGLSFVTYISDPDEWCLMLRAPGVWRVMFPVSPDEPDEETLSDHAVQRRLQALRPKATDYEIAHRTIYRVQHRIAESYRSGRILLAGDAAHANNPLGGMGLNSGIHDSFNLADKLVNVLRGNATGDLLDVYSRQRRFVSVEHVNAQAARNKQLLEQCDPAKRQQSLDELRQTADDPARSREYMLRASLISSLRQAASIQ